MKILGIDPGSQKTGIGIINYSANKMHYVHSACISLQGEFNQRIKELVIQLRAVIIEHKPDLVSIESVFVHKNPNSALKLGQARGAILSVILTSNLELYEYTPRLVKQTVTGWGNADKQQIQQMVKLLLKLDFVPQVDAADALALAITYASNSVSMSGYKHNRYKKRTKKNSWRSQSHLG